MAQFGVEMTFGNHEAVVPDVAVTTTSVLQFSSPSWDSGRNYAGTCMAVP
jgi:hypothetical protein